MEVQIGSDAYLFMASADVWGALLLLSTRLEIFIPRSAESSPISPAYRHEEQKNSFSGRGRGSFSEPLD